MASRLLNPNLFRTPFFTAGLGISAAFCLSPLLLQYRSRPLLLDSTPSSARPQDWSFNQYTHDARVPIVTKDGQFNRRAVRQLSLGSTLGLVAGLGVSFFSKPLALLLGLLVVGLQTVESYGIHIVPYKRLQRFVTGVDLRSAVQDNVAFKVSFGMMLALSAFAEL